MLFALRWQKYSWIPILLFWPVVGALSSEGSTVRSASLDSIPTPTSAWTTLSGRPVCRYALGGAARSSQPESLARAYHDRLQHGESNDQPRGAPFYFYYNPHRYPAFLSGIQAMVDGSSNDASQREDLFVASGGTERSASAMEQRLDDALKYCGGEYLDMFVLEYVCPYEFQTAQEELVPGTALMEALQQARSWVEQGRVRYVAASTHSHRVGAALASQTALLDALMLRYSMSHKDAAELWSFPMCCEHNMPVIAFTTTRWNALQKGHPEWKKSFPTTGDCLSFALAEPPVEVVLHSARDGEELSEAMTGFRGDMTQDELLKWRSYGDLEWNEDSFDEYPLERTQT